MARPSGINSAAVIREYAAGDAEAVIALIRELQAHELPFNRHLKPAENIGPWYVERILADCEKFDGVVLMAMAGGQPAGCAVLLAAMVEKGEQEELPHTYAVISELVVSASARGQGIGRALLAECERRARNAGRDELRLGVLAANESARRLYASAGYSEVKIRMCKALQ